MAEKTGDDRLVKLADLISKRFESEFEAFVEQVDEQNEVLQNNLSALLDKRLKPVEGDIAQIKSDMKAVKAAIKETNRDIQLLETRVERLETVS